MRHASTYCWPPIVAVGPILLGYFLGANRPDVFRYTHGYLEIAAVIGFMVAVAYAIRLWPQRGNPKLRIPLYMNLGFVVLILIGGIVGFIESSLG